ncbi:hypothetical protein DPMN_017781 [Dreissena polymorpha]|uniref:Uncharacterized protein n=1 Tax=Dreissena polymorpha TaxID=45954 RepID=A0A9D4NFH5_DREPO|nr:hypothetical protein DPMN_017781 [Dreissena polymorpha]
MARRHNPYHVVPLSYNDFIDFIDLKSRNPKAVNTDSGVKVNWTHTKWMRFTATDPVHVFSTTIRMIRIVKEFYF